MSNGPIGAFGKIRPATCRKMKNATFSGKMVTFLFCESFATYFRENGRIFILRLVAKWYFATFFRSKKMTRKMRPFSRKKIPFFILRPNFLGNAHFTPLYVLNHAPLI